MKTKVILLALALGASTCLLTAQDNNQRPDGQRPPPREGGPGGPGGGPGGPGGLGGERGGPGGQRMMMPNPIVEALDLNHDGTIDADEIAKASASLKKLDKNGDGKITPEEYRPQRPGGQGGQGGPGGPGGQGGNGQGRRPGGPGGQGGENRPQRPPEEK